MSKDYLDLLKTRLIDLREQLKEKDKKLSDYNDKFLHQDRVIDDLIKDLGLERGAK